MDLIIYIAIGVLLLGALSIVGGMIIRHTGRKQAGLPFYISMATMVVMLAYGVFPMLQLAGLAKTVVYALGACTSVLFSQYVFGEKIAKQ
jgi:predicted membrane channel-forming protein YqfA (hemolysin III family)